MKAALPAHAHWMRSLLASDKANVSCQIKRGTHAEEGEIRGRGIGAVCAGEGTSRGLGNARLESGRRTREERTANMALMPVTLDVSKLSG